jgi:GNAT superfamily N-acetyltransferase
LPTSSSPSESLRAEVRRFAEDPGAFGTIRPESGLTRVLTDRYCLLLGPVPTFTSVSRLRLAPEDVAETLTEIRDLVATQGHREAMWWVGASATPADLVDRLAAHGLVPDRRPSSEPHATALVLTDEPEPGPADIEVRRVASLEEFVAAQHLAGEAFGEPPGQAAEWEAIAEQRFRAERDGFAPRVYLARLDGEPVGVGRALFAEDCPAVLMIGGGVLARARGRGVYRALVRARWEDAVAEGFRALTTHAGAMSRPILERLGFQAVAEIEIMLDP